MHGCTGVTVIGEVNQLTTHVMNVLWLLGTFTFAIVIGIIGEDVTNTIMVRAKHLAQPLHITCSASLITMAVQGIMRTGLTWLLHAIPPLSQNA